jgi:hypothetical protein
VARIPDKKEHQAKLMQLDFKERRAIVRAVNRGEAVEKRAHAPLAVAVARRQQRLWKVAWLLGPIVGAVQLLLTTVEAAITNAIIGTVALGMMSAFWLWRARRSEERNLALMEGRRGSVSGGSRATTTDKPASWTDRFRRSSRTGTSAESGDRPRPATPRGHLPGEGARRQASNDADAPDRADGRDAGGLGPKPPQPRGKKRR